MSVTTNAVKKTGVRRTTNVRMLAQIAMLSAVAAVLMLVEVPLPFLAPTFYQLDLSELPVLIGAFALGPLAGMMIEMIKILLNFVLNGTLTAGVGELANFLIGCALVVPAGYIYRRGKTKKSALIGMGVGTVCMALAGGILNAFLLLPAYGKAFGMPVDAFVEMGSAIFPVIDNLFTFCLFSVVPFNMVKGILVSVITMFLYKHISRLLKGNQMG
ncbi:MAG: ECF transporter S component [Oliverpabstia sp.]|nr:ECF transporter S component [Oliverpabstia sp.]